MIKGCWIAELSLRYDFKKNNTKENAFGKQFSSVLSKDTNIPT